MILPELGQAPPEPDGHGGRHGREGPDGETGGRALDQQRSRRADQGGGRAEQHTPRHHHDNP
ncbi:hypothetical protein [Streptomyces sp. NPDC047525]|uniref:hypothetical protein n=1 Tax=Streptomyces sp. NPDC047525 TaxID=3155264 RepID=UPI0033DB351B